MCFVTERTNQQLRHSDAVRLQVWPYGPYCQKKFVNGCRPLPARACIFTLRQSHLHVPPIR